MPTWPRAATRPPPRRRAHLARPTFYERLRLIERILGVSLESAESRTSLHVALLAVLAGHHPRGRLVTG